MDKLQAIVYDPANHGYHVMGERVGTAFADGKKSDKRLIFLLLSLLLSVIESGSFLCIKQLLYDISDCTKQLSDEYVRKGNFYILLKKTPSNSCKKICFTVK